MPSVASFCGTSSCPSKGVEDAVPTYCFREQCWDDAAKSDLLGMITPGEGLVVEIHAQVNSMMIGTLLEVSEKCRKENTSMEVVVFNRNSERSLEFFGLRQVLTVRRPTDTERVRKCARKCDQPCRNLDCPDR